jgi:hypothetical protein
VLEGKKDLIYISTMSESHSIRERLVIQQGKKEIVGIMAMTHHGSFADPLRTPPSHMTPTTFFLSLFQVTTWF